MKKYTYKHELGENIKGTIEVKIVEKHGHTYSHHFITKEVDGVIINSTALLVKDSDGTTHIEEWYAIYNKKHDEVYRVCELNIIKK